MRYTIGVPKVVRWVRLTTLVVGVGAVSGLACGGRSETSTDSSESTRPNGSSGSGDPTATGAGDDDDGGVDGDLDLGECVEGWPVYEGECPWEGSDHLCYATKADACACLCPRDRRSTCLSGLPGGPDSHTAVSCF